MRAWLFQDSRQKKKHREKKCPWSVGWHGPDGRESKRVGSKSMAEKYRRKIEGEMAAGLYQKESRKSWADFRAEYDQKKAARMKPDTRRETILALKHFERIAKPRQVDRIKTQTIDGYVSKRCLEPGKKRGDLVSPATVNKELRHIKAVLGIAHEWEYLPKMPKVTMLKEPYKLPTYVTPEHFAAMYGAAGVARMPKGLPYPAADWWRALFTFNYMTGWRVSEPLSLLRDDLDLDEGSAITRHDDNKGNRDDRVPLTDVVVEHLRGIVSFDALVFLWPHCERSLWREFERIQRAGGIHLPCRGDHEHTPACHTYGFHDLRRAFATMNAPTLSADALQSLMRHKSYATTQRYINMTGQLTRAVDNLYVPDVLRKKA